MKTTRDMFEHELADIYDAEHQFLEGQRLMRQNAGDPKLQTLIQTHMKESETQIKNLEQVFKLIGLEPKRQTCSGAQGIVNEGQKVMQETSAVELRDAAITGAAAKVEHYEMVSYNDLIEGAQLMGQPKVVQLLEKNRQEEIQAAEKMEKEGSRLLKAAQKAEKK